MSTPTQMQHLVIANHTRVMAADQEEYTTLCIRDEPMANGTNMMVSEWKPTQHQLEQLRAGATIYLGIEGENFPPVMLMVADPSPQKDHLKLVDEL